jgi:hypothetical protein
MKLLPLLRIFLVSLTPEQNLGPGAKQINTEIKKPFFSQKVHPNGVLFFHCP